MNKTKLFIALAACIGLTVSCSDGEFDPLHIRKNYEDIDPKLDLDRDDYRNITAPGLAQKGPPPIIAPDDGSRPPELANFNNVMEPTLPQLAETLIAPKPPKIGQTKLVSVAVTDDVPLKDVVIELARLADVDVEVDAGISGGISFRAKDRPFNEVMERISDLAGLRYSMKNGVLRVERDTPYVQIYALDFLNMDRSVSSGINIDTAVLTSGASDSGGGGGGGGGLGTGSSASISSTAKADFWAQFEESIKRLIAYTPVSKVSSAAMVAQPIIVPPTPAPAAPEAAPAGPANGGGASGGKATNTPAATVAAAPTTPAAAGATPAGPATPAPVVAPAPVAQSNSSGGAAANGDLPFYIVNRQASTLTVSGTERQHELIRKFLDKLRINSSSQVLIEAKIVEVTLDDRFQAGINWSAVSNSVNFTSDLSQIGEAVTPAAAIDITKKIGSLGTNLDLAVRLAENFGTTRTLSSPRLHAMNNQQAVLTFAQNLIYFELEAKRDQTAIGSSSSSTETLTVSSTIKTVPVGIIMSMQPSINSETNEITLSVRPTLSRVVNYVDDPGAAATIALLQQQGSTTGIDLTSLKNRIPIIEVRELDSILKIQSGQVMVIGGLMEDSATNVDSGIPGFSSIPYFGNLFRGVNRSNQIKELVIFIRATLVDSYGSAHKADKELYNTFTRDPRPLEFDKKGE